MELLNYTLEGPGDEHLAFKRMRQEDHEFRASLSYTLRPCLEQHKTNSSDFYVSLYIKHAESNSSKAGARIHICLSSVLIFHWVTDVQPKLKETTATVH